MDRIKLHRIGDRKIFYIEKNGQRHWHNPFGPAYIAPDGSKHWYLYHKRHRIDGPAVEFTDGVTLWYLDNKKLPKDEVEAWIKENNINLKTEEGKVAFKLRWS